MQRDFAQWSGLPASTTDLLLGWELVPLWRKGVVVGMAILNGTEIHFAVAPTHRHLAIQRHRAREFLLPLMERRGYLTTRSDQSDEAARRFLTRMGFKHTWNDGQFDHYMLSELPFGKEP